MLQRAVVCLMPLAVGCGPDACFFADNTITCSAYDEGDPSYADDETDETFYLVLADGALDGTERRIHAEIDLLIDHPYMTLPDDPAMGLIPLDGHDPGIIDAQVRLVGAVDTDRWERVVISGNVRVGSDGRGSIVVSGIPRNFSESFGPEER